MNKIRINHLIMNKFNLNKHTTDLSPHKPPITNSWLLGKKENGGRRENTGNGGKRRRGGRGEERRGEERRGEAY